MGNWVAFSQTDVTSMTKLIILSHLRGSGSTFLASRLCMLPDICGGLESSAFIELIEQFPTGVLPWTPEGTCSYLIRDPDIREWPISFEILRRSLQEAAGTVTFADVLHAIRRSFRNNAQFLLLKGRGLNRHCDSLRAIYPDMVIIHSIRDPRGIYNSQRKSLPATRKTMFSDPVRFAMKFCRTVKRIRACKTKVDSLEIKYEDLLIDADAQVNYIANHIGIKQDYSDISHNIQFLDLVPRRRRNLHENVEKKSIVSRVEAWREELDIVDRYLIQAICRNEIQFLGLPREEIKVRDFGYSKLAKRLRGLLVGNIRLLFRRSINATQTVRC